MLVKVARVIDTYNLVLNVGEVHQINIGQRFLIYTIEDEIFDPDTGESLGYFEKVKGIGKVTHVQDKICTITSDTLETPSRVVRKTDHPILSYMGQQVTEETTRPEVVPFKNPKIGDLAKQI